MITIHDLLPIALAIVLVFSSSLRNIPHTPNLMITIHLLLIVLAIVFAGLATFKTPEHPRLSFLAAAVFTYLLSIYVS